MQRKIDSWPLGWVALAFAVVGLAYRPAKLLTLLSVPLLVVLFIIGALFLHLVLSYLAALRVAADRTDDLNDPVVPLLSIATPSGFEAIRIRKSWSDKDTDFRKPLHPTSAKVSTAVDKLLATILDNHLRAWYTVAISPSDPSFPNAVEKTIRESLAVLCGKLLVVDWANLGVATLLPKITNHLDVFQESQQSLLASSGSSAQHLAGEQPSKARKKKDSPGAAPASDELDLLLAEKYAELSGKGSLHAAVSGASFNSRPSEEKHLRKLVANILRVIVPAREGGSAAVSTMAMEIVACAIIRPIIEAISDPDLWNRLLDDKAGSVIREQRMVNKLRAALDANPVLPSTSTGSVPNRRSNETISINSTSRHFESFLRSLSRCPNLLEAKRIRNDIDVSLRRARLPGSYIAEPPEAVLRYIERMVVAKQTIDRRIGELGGGQSFSASPPTSASTTLHDVLQQPGALSFFMEYMDRKNRSMLVQFHLTIEGLKDPLEDPDNHGAFAQELAGESMIDPASLQTLSEDLQLLLTSYILPKAVIIDANLTQILQAFQTQQLVSRETVSAVTYRGVRRTIFAAQLQIYEEMLEVDWPNFQRSDLFVKAVANMPARTIYTDAKRPDIAGRKLSAKEPVLPSSASGSSRESQTNDHLVRPPSGSRAGSQASPIRPPYRARVSTRDQPFQAKQLDFLTGSPRIGDDGIPNTKRSPLFREEGMDDVANDTESYSEEPDNIEQLKTMEAIQEALTSILEGEGPDRPRVRREGSVESSYSVEGTSVNNSPEQVRRPVPPLMPSATSKPLRPVLHTRSTSTISRKDGKDETGLILPNPDDQGYDSEDLTTTARTRAPGDLSSSFELEKVTVRLEKLKYQQSVLVSLLDKAELTGNTNETKILRKSVDALNRELSQLDFQKRQFESQANESALLPRRTTVRITGTTVGQSQGKEFALYLIEVHQLAEDGFTQAAGWLVTRRFSEFVALQNTLKEKVPAARKLELPQKRLVASLSSNLLQQRKVALERYLQALVILPEACRNPDFRSFLSQQNITLRNESPMTAALASASELIPGQGLLRNLFRSVTTGMDDMFGGPSMLDAIILRLSQQAADFATIGGNLSASLQGEDLIAPAGDAGAGPDGPIDLLSLSAGLSTVEGEGLTYFTAPIANLLVEIFDLKDKGSWLRRQAIVIILQQVLGGTIERKVRDAIAISLGGDALLPHIEMMSNMMYPDGKLRPSSIPRTAQEKSDTRESAYRKLAYLMPDIAASIIGRVNARRGARRIFSVMQNRRLNQHLIYALLDDILSDVFGPAIIT